MAYRDLKAVRPGINTELTALSNREGFSLSSLIRWRWQAVECLRGWFPLFPGAAALPGMCRAVHWWTDLVAKAHYAFGTTQKLLVYDSVGTLTDITAPSFVPGPVSSGSTPYSLLIWSLDNWGQILIAIASGQYVFYWDPTTPPPSQPLLGGPAQNQGGFVVMPEQIIMAYGCTPIGGGAQDPLLLRWSSQGDFTDWTPTTTNQAGSFRLPRGSRIIGGIQAPSIAVIWTDVDVWTAVYEGFPLVFGLFQAGSQCGLIAQKAACVLGSVTYWMSDHGIFQLASSGAVQLPCPIWDAIYLNLDEMNEDKCLLGADYHYSEIWGFFPSVSGGTGEIDSYWKYNITEGEWDYGPATVGVPNEMARTAWTDDNKPGHPLSVDLFSIIQQADTGFTVGNSNNPVPGYIRTGYQDIADGARFQLVDQFIPDFLWEGTSPSLDLTLYFRDYPGGQETVMGPFTIDPTTEYVTLRTAQTMTVAGVTIIAYPAVRAREVSVEIKNSQGWWRWGASRLRVAPSGSL